MTIYSAINGPCSSNFSANRHVFCGTWAACRMRGPDVEGQGQKITGDFRVGPQLSINKNKGVLLTENWPLNFLSPFRSVAMMFKNLAT